jgi:hypothetical protein
VLVKITEQVPICIYISNLSMLYLSAEQNCLTASIFQLPIYSRDQIYFSKVQINYQNKKGNQKSKSQTIVTGPPLYLGLIISEQIPSSVAFLLLPLTLLVELLIVVQDLFWSCSWHLVDFFNICGFNRLTSESWTGLRKNSSAPSSMHLYSIVPSELPAQNQVFLRLSCLSGT